MVYGNWEVQKDSHLEQMAMKGAFVKIQSNGWFGIFKRPLQWLYPLEVRSVENASSASHMSDDTPQSDTFPSPQGASDSVITAGEPEVKMIWMRTDIWTNFVSNYSIHFFYSVGMSAQCVSYYGHNFLNLGCHVRGTWPASCKLAKGAEWIVSEHELHQFFYSFCFALPWFAIYKSVISSWNWQC